MSLKLCSKCKYVKGPDEFSLNRARPDGLQNQCKECQKGRPYDPVRAKNVRLKCLYGITSADYDEMLAKQGGGCAICGGENSDGRPLFVDHDHETGLVRALLCGACNSGIGYFKDDPELMEVAANYVRRFHFTVSLQEED